MLFVYIELGFYISLKFINVYKIYQFKNIDYI